MQTRGTVLCSLPSFPLSSTGYSDGELGKHKIFKGNTSVLSAQLGALLPQQ